MFAALQLTALLNPAAPGVADVCLRQERRESKYTLKKESRKQGEGKIRTEIEHKTEKK